ncbi:uncharacterized protein AMSG_09192 [Thecamonas trahens ATCC 50062]|uniref:BOS complex subunit NCLN n=1 Tax=Thecamonas trahens ATCC 50062 TaxID=461836 RepID=A0A0L0DL21_THETB|nr:hypothetical protein AMSG_09192 [Thecamonas trahens ATCC 50062]KNC53012.1 hypothetical protein AMSG_09192 [Thecamonas trahens ATCC 50062]|eukprot:XP_013754898.1 hypothetical protein AMSG_09192 [Thecamonas trahens ATCC 50062]
MNRDKMTTMAMSMTMMMAVVVVLTCVGGGAQAAGFTTAVHPLTSYGYSGASYGSIAKSVTGSATLSATPWSSTTMAVIVLTEESLAHDIVNALVTSPPRALVLVLPSPDAAWAAEVVAAMETELMWAKIECPVMMAFADEIGEEGMKELDELTLSVKTSAKEIKTGDAANVEAWLIGSQGERAKTIVVAAHYDALAAAPSLASGSDANGAGLVALLSVARSFGRLYATEKTRGAYNVVFVATAAGKLGFAGAKAWLADASAMQLRNVELVVCVDALGAPGVNLLSTDVPQSGKKRGPAGSAASDAFEAALAELGAGKIELELDPEARTYAFEHERFARRGLAAYTVSSHSAPYNMLRTKTAAVAGAYDAADRDALVANIHTVTTALVRVVFPHLGLAAAADLARPDAGFVDAWASYLEATPRFAPLLATPTGAPVVAAITKALNSALPAADVTASDFKLVVPYTFTAPTASAELSAYKQTSPIYDLLAFLAAGAYVVGVYAYFVGPSAAVAAVLSYVTSKPSSATKAKTKKSKSKKE